jgi:hypothetical protein
MSVSMAVRLENQTGRSARLSNFEDMYAEKKSLDRAAKAAGVASLFSFTHSTGEEREWGRKALGDPDVDETSLKEEQAFEKKLEKTLPKVGKWYAAADGLKTVDALLAHRKASGAAEGSVEHQLKELLKVLNKAAKARHRFRLVGE